MGLVFYASLLFVATLAAFFAAFWIMFADTKTDAGDKAMALVFVCIGLAAANELLAVLT